MARAELIIFSHFDVVSSTVTELRPTADQEVLLSPYVAGLQEAELQAAAARESSRHGGETVEPAVQEGPADGAARPAAPRRWGSDARAERVCREGQCQQPSHSFLVNRELEDAGHLLEASQGCGDTTVISRAVHRRGQAQVPVPALHGVERVLGY
jgi:hypothetical protein